MLGDPDSRALNTAAVLAAAAALVFAVSAVATALRSPEPLSGALRFATILGLVFGVAVTAVAVAAMMLALAVTVSGKTLEKPWQALKSEENKPTVVLALLALLAGGLVYAARQVSEEWSPVWSFSLVVVPLVIAAVSAALVSVSVRETDIVRIGWVDWLVLGVQFLGVLIPLVVVIVGAFTQDWLAGFRALNVSEKVLLICSALAYGLGVLLLVVLLWRQRREKVEHHRSG